MTKSQHVLIIGGTGMLSGVSLHFAKKGYAVTLIGRSKEKFNALLIKASCPMFLLNGDYNSEEIFLMVSEEIKTHGLFDIIVSWTPNYGALERICKLNKGAEQFMLVHVKGSGRYFQDEKIQIEPTCDYRKVFLGFQIEESGSRWLTHEEIAAGVIQQICSEEKESIVGQIQPYEKRPQ